MRQGHNGNWSQYKEMDREDNGEKQQKRRKEESKKEEERAQEHKGTLYRVTRGELELGMLLRGIHFKHFFSA